MEREGVTAHHERRHKKEMMRESRCSFMNLMQGGVSGGDI